MVSPSAQVNASTWLEITVSDVEAIPLETNPAVRQVSVTAEVVNVFKSPSGLKAGDSITIDYTYDPRPKYSEDGKRMLGPSSPALLKVGRQTYAFLNKLPDVDVYVPGAHAWSFAPPFGVPKAERDELGMKAPAPPKAPPPPPPSFQVPMKGPQMPASPPPNFTPPPPPGNPPDLPAGE